VLSGFLPVSNPHCVGPIPSSPPLGPESSQGPNRPKSNAKLLPPLPGRGPRPNFEDVVVPKLRRPPLRLDFFPFPSRCVSAAPRQTPPVIPPPPPPLAASPPPEPGEFSRCMAAPFLHRPWTHVAFSFQRCLAAFFFRRTKNGKPHRDGGEYCHGLR